MNSRLYIPALITLGLGILSGCGGSSSSEQAYLPTGLQRTLDITLQDGKPYVFSFIIASESTATIYTGTSPAASTASLHVVNYKPSSDSAEQIGFYWSSNDGETTNNLDALVVLYNNQQAGCPRRPESSPEYLQRHRFCHLQRQRRRIY